MAKHTEGPWDAVFHADSIIIDAKDGSLTIAEVHDHGDTSEQHTAAEAEANARLIAAAPDLLRELRDLLKFCEDHAPGWRYEFGLTAHAAISKAEGIE